MSLGRAVIFEIGYCSIQYKYSISDSLCNNGLGLSSSGASRLGAEYFSETSSRLSASIFSVILGNDQFGRSSYEEVEQHVYLTSRTC